MVTVLARPNGSTGDIQEGANGIAGHMMTGGGLQHRWTDQNSDMFVMEVVVVVGSCPPTVASRWPRLRPRQKPACGKCHTGDLAVLLTYVECKMDWWFQTLLFLEPRTSIFDISDCWVS